MEAFCSDQESRVRAHKIAQAIKATRVPNMKYGGVLDPSKCRAIYVIRLGLMDSAVSDRSDCARVSFSSEHFLAQLNTLFPHPVDIYTQVWFGLVTDTVLLQLSCPCRQGEAHNRVMAVLGKRKASQSCQKKAKKQP
eukprot:1145898-Pelagomonas_calceolata.AAC.6